MVELVGGLTYLRSNIKAHGNNESEFLLRITITRDHTREQP